MKSTSKTPRAMNFHALVENITSTHQHFQHQAFKAINRSLTLRNWIIGWYIVEFEQRGENRAQYGQRLLHHLAKHLAIKGLISAELSRCRQFYHCYPQILGTVSQELPHAKIGHFHLAEPRKKGKSILQSQHLDTDHKKYTLQSQILTEQLSFNHFVELIKIEDPLKRTFYELQCIQGTWSVRTLRRQIHSLYFERMGMSRNPESLQEITNAKIPTEKPENLIKSVYAFEFLNIDPKGAIEENELISSLLDHIQHFLLEMGHGFCFESRQQKLLIGDEYFFVDLVFYHRILKCHALVELKVGNFEHFQTAQLNTYLNYYKQKVRQEDDQSPVGILLVTDKNQALVEFATAGMDNQLFVSKYLLELPEKDKLQAFIEKELKDLTSQHNSEG